MTGDNNANKAIQHRTVFHELLGSAMENRELTEEMMQHEALSITGAGIDTTKTALSIASFWILQKPEIQERLVIELERAVPDPDNLPSLTELEKLPYLSAVIQECKQFPDLHFLLADLYSSTHVVWVV